jgi:uncharacterized membrane protein
VRRWFKARFTAQLDALLAAAILALAVHITKVELLLLGVILGTGVGAYIKKPCLFSSEYFGSEHQF